MNELVFEKIKHKISNLPNNPGVYLMKDNFSNIIYIGKAKSLKSRVGSYFLNTKKTQKVTKMIEKVSDFDYIITNSEYDALNLESNLIKKHQPFYNVLLKQGRGHAFLKIDLKKEYPVLEVTRTVKKDGAKYFGPYFSGVSVRDLLEVISSAFMLMDFNLKTNTDRPYYREYFNYFITGKKRTKEKINKEEYLEEVKKVVDFLNGDLDTAKNILQDKMNASAKAEHFERAIEYRKGLELIEKLKSKVITELKQNIDIDIFGYAYNEMFSTISLHVVRAGKLIGVNNHFIKNAVASEEEIFNDFILQYYEKNKQIPSEIVANYNIEETVNMWLQNNNDKKVYLTYPQKGIKKQLLNMANKNAQEHLEQNVEKSKLKILKTQKAMESLTENLELNRPPKRIECYDISNIQGSFIVASMVVFVDGEPLKQHYRKFKIKSVIGKNNDFESMREVIARRFNNINSNDASFSKVPDLIVIDGGKGQLSSAYEVIKNAGFSNINIVSLAEQFEEIFVPHKSNSIYLNKNNFGLQLLQNIRDEAHRFALAYHKNLRNKGVVSSQLENINGVGKETIKKLMAHFKSIKAIKLASVEDILKINGISEKVANNIFNYFNNINNN